MSNKKERELKQILGSIAYRFGEGGSRQEIERLLGRATDIALDLGAEMSEYYMKKINYLEGYLDDR